MQLQRAVLTQHQVECHVELCGVLILSATVHTSDSRQSCCTGHATQASMMLVQVREHILRTQAQEISWQELCKICQGMEQDDIKQMVSEYESYNLWIVEHDANGHVRLMVEDLG